MSGADTELLAAISVSSFIIEIDNESEFCGRDLLFFDGKPDIVFEYDQG